MIKIYGGRMGTALRNHWTLAEIGMEYETVELNMRGGEHKSPEFLAINPMGQVPAMVDGDFVLTESMAINSYLAEKFKPELMGDSVEVRANAWKWSIWSYLHIDRHFGAMAFQALWAAEKDQEVFDKAAENVKQYLPMLDKHLANNQFVAGKNFTVADINAGVAVGYGMYAQFDFSPYPNIVRWTSELMARPGYLKATGK